MLEIKLPSDIVIVIMYYTPIPKRSKKCRSQTLTHAIPSLFSLHMIRS